MEFFSDFNYDDLEEINMSGGGNMEVPEPAPENDTDAGNGLNIQMSEEIKKGETMEAQNAAELSSELNKDPSSNIDRDTELKFNPNLSEKLNDQPVQTIQPIQPIDLNALPETGQDAGPRLMGPRTPPEPEAAAEPLGPRTPPEPEAAAEPLGPRTPPEPEPEAEAFGPKTPPEPEAEPLGPRTPPEPEAQLMGPRTPPEPEAEPLGPRTPPEPEDEPEPERSEMPAEEQAPPEEETEATVKDAPDADPKQLDFLKLLQKKSSKKEGLLLSEIEDITRDEQGVYHSVNKLLQRLESDKYSEYTEKLNYMYESQVKHAKDYTFTNKGDTLTQKTNPKSKRNNELVTITKPGYQDTKKLLEYLNENLSEVEYNLKQLHSEALDESKKRKNLGEINKLKDSYFKLSEQIKLVTQYHKTVNNSVQNTNRVNNNLLQIGKNSAEKRLLFSEINGIINTDPMDQEKLDEKIKQYIALGEDTTKLRAKIDEINETPSIDYMIVKEPSVSVRKLKESAKPTKDEDAGATAKPAEKPKKRKIKVKSKAKPKSKDKGKMKGGGDKNKSLETVIETIDLLNQESSSESEGEGEAEASTEAHGTVEEIAPEAEAEQNETKKIFITNETDSNLDNTDDLEEIDLTGGAVATAAGGGTKIENEFKIDTLDLDDDLAALADYSDDDGDSSGGSDNEQIADFSSTYTSDSNDTLDTAESIPLNLNENKNNSEETEEPKVNVIKLGQ